MHEESTEENKEETLLLEEPSFFLHYRKIITNFLFACILVSLVFYLSLWRAPSDFPVHSIVRVESGESLQVTTQKFTALRMIRSPFIFRSLVILLGGEKKVTAGDYLLTIKESPLTLAWRIIEGRLGMEPVKVTVPEGLNVSEISGILSKNLISFDVKTFEALAKEKEGYLFPDTYFFPPTAKPEDVMSRMQENFIEKIKSIQQDIELFGKSEKDVVTMASILEGEARDTESRRIVAGILWRRMSIGMPLQVDATFKYINGKNSFNLTYADLKIESPYNTYVVKGLPPTPINNPGINALLAAVTPIKTDYLYFLTGDDGKMYYAKTFEAHKINKAKYLK